MTTWTEVPLFELEPLIEAVPVDVTLSAGARRTRRQHELLAAGVHPATGKRIVAELGTCAHCAHLRKVTPGNRTVYKCPHHRLGCSHSEASDMRVSWPACELFATVTCWREIGTREELARQAIERGEV